MLHESHSRPVLRIWAKPLIVILLLLGGAAHADDWPQIFGPNRNGASKETGLAATWPKGGPPLIWEKEAGEAYSAPVVAGNRLILFHRLKDEEVVDCLDAHTGKPLWRFNYSTSYMDALGKGDGPRSTPVIVQDRVITLGAEGKLHCIDLKKGTKVWDKDFHKDYAVPNSFFGVGTTPLVVDDRVLVNVGGKKAGIVAFSLKDGSELWKATNDGASYASPVLYQKEGKKLAVFFTREGVAILDPMNGNVVYQQRWRARIAASVNAATPLLIGDRAFFSACYDTGALLLKLEPSVKELWNAQEVMDNHYNTCVHHEGHLFGFHGRQETKAMLRCVDLESKKATWSKDHTGCGSIILAEGRLIILLESGEVLLLEANPMKNVELGRFKGLDAPPCRAEIALAAGHLYARDQRHIKCWDLRKK